MQAIKNQRRKPLFGGLKMKQDIYLINSEKQHLKNQAMRLYKSWKVCNNEERNRFLAEQFNKVAEMYVGRTRE